MQNTHTMYYKHQSYVLYQWNFISNVMYTTASQTVSHKYQFLLINSLTHTTQSYTA